MAASKTRFKHVTETLPDQRSSVPTPVNTPSPTAPSSGPLATPPATRYSFEPASETTAMSLVGSGYDHLLERPIFWKSPRSNAPSVLQLFERECLIAARLNHPHILRIYDRIWMDGSLRAILPRVTGAELTDWLASHTADKGLADDIVLLQLFQQICLAVAHAHGMGIVHSDIKPSNVLYSPPGTAYLIDWGAAQLYDPPCEPGLTDGSSTLTALSTQYPALLTVTRTCSPGFAAPEQLAQGPVTPATDVFGLGSLLYYLLTHQPPFPPLLNQKALQARLRLRAQRSLHERFPARQIPLALESLCMSCLEPEPTDRPASALTVYDAISDYILGRRLETERRKRAANILRRAQPLVEGYLATGQSVQDIVTAPLTAAPGAPGSRTPALRQVRESRLWQLQQTHRRLFMEATRLLHQTLELDDDQPMARQTLVSLYLDRLKALEAFPDSRDGEDWEFSHLESLIRQYDDGSGAAYLDALAEITIQGDQGVAELAEIRETDWELRAGPPELLGRLPQTQSCQPGRYQLIVRRYGCIDSRYPLRLRRGQQLHLEPELLPSSAVPAGFAFVPAGPARLGGDAEAFAPHTRDVVLASFAIGIFPTTCQEYLDFLNALALHDLPQALAHAPRTPSGALRWELHTSQFRLPDLDGEGDTIDPTFPVTLISALDAEAYCAWRASRDGIPYRLPFPDEWEKAARGADERYYPWGDRYIPGHCNNRDGESSKPKLVSVQAFPTDCSPYGVRGLAGGVGDWTAATLHAEKQRERQVRGGSWYVSERQCRLARVVSMAEDKVAPSVGFRLLIPLGG